MKNGVILAMISAFVFSVMNALVKAVSLSMPATEVVFFTSIIGTGGIYFLMLKNKVAFSTDEIHILILRGVLGALCIITYFYTISKISLVDVIILTNLSPVFVILLAAVFLKEKFSRKTFYILPIVFVGAILTIKPFNYSVYSVDALVGVLSAVFAAGAAISIRYLSKKHHAFEIIFYLLAATTLVSIPFMWYNFVTPTTIELFYLVCIGVVALFGQVFQTKAYTYENAIVVEFVRYIGIVFNALWGFIFWVEVPDASTVLGGTLIIVACVAMSWKK